MDKERIRELRDAAVDILGILQENAEQIEAGEQPAPPADSTFIAHIQSHLKPGQEVVCKICGKTAKEICHEIS